MSKQTRYIKPMKDERGKSFLSICTYGWHPGIPREANQCEQRQCRHYVRVYLSNRVETPHPNGNISCNGKETGLETNLN